MKHLYENLSPLEISSLKATIGKHLQATKYGSTSSPDVRHGVVGLCFDGKWYELKNELELTHFCMEGEEKEEMPLLSFKEVNGEEEINASLEGYVEVKSESLNDLIEDIIVIDMDTKLFKREVPIQERLFTCGIVFVTDKKQICFQQMTSIDEFMDYREGNDCLKELEGLIDYFEDFDDIRFESKLIYRYLKEES